LSPSPLLETLKKTVFSFLLPADPPLLETYANFVRIL
jgi:hypothetical protein